MKKIHPLNKIKIVGLLVSAVALVIILGGQNVYKAQAGPGDNVHGWLWSDMPDPSDQVKTPNNTFGGRGLGYISLNSSDQGVSGTYGVKLDMNTGDLSGAGWSEYGGWLDFDPAGTPPLASGTSATPAKIMPSCWTDTSQNVCPVIGWVRFFVGTQSITNQWGGWDGWVSLYTNTINPNTQNQNYGVFYNKATKKFSGKAWGSDVAGWIDFSNATVDDTDVCPNLPDSQPTVPPGYHTEVVNVPVTGHNTGGLTNLITVPQTWCIADTGNDLCPDNLNTELPGTQTYLPAQGIDGAWYNDLHPLPNGGDGRCEKTADLCPSVPGNQSPNATNTWQVPAGTGIWYGMTNGICSVDACPDVAGDLTTTGFQATIPTNYTVAHGQCIPSGQGPGGSGTGQPVNPIYKEN